MPINILEINLLEKKKLKNKTTNPEQIKTVLTTHMYLCHIISKGKVKENIIKIFIIN